MGKCETAKASIGIRILLSDLVLQINETNFNLIKEMLNSGFIEDGDDYYNEAYDRIIYCDESRGDKLSGNYLDVKEYLINKFKDVGDSSYGGILFDQAFLLPLNVILENDRWGDDRFSTNAISRPIDFDLSVNIEKYKDIENIKIVFILSQRCF